MNEYDDEYGPQPCVIFATIVILMFYKPVNNMNL